MLYHNYSIPLVSKKIIFLLLCTIIITPSILKSSWLCCCCPQEEEQDNFRAENRSHELFLQGILPFPATHRRHNTQPHTYQDEGDDTAPTTEVAIITRPVHQTFSHQMCNSTRNPLSDQNDNDILPPRTRTASTPLACQPLIPIIPITLSTRQNSTHAQNILEYEQKRTSINDELESINRRSNILLSTKKDDDFRIRHARHLSINTMLHRHLPRIHGNLSLLIENIDVVHTNQREIEQIFTYITEFVDNCDPRHKDIIHLWLTCYAQDEIREKSIILEYVQTHIKTKFQTVSDPVCYFQQNALAQNRDEFLRCLYHIAIDDSVTKQAINNYTNDHPDFRNIISEVFDRLFENQCDALL